ncbi:hypothetical protein [Candidatus Chlamydia sanziniae]|uniref:Uncharacterized protein n=1 Tax=Candidatus Chlamydia sanziniae TaxID=1806891 RepID=A0A1A9HY87_9CHLA|nr:hypothetical protein [Candidatus Chlamydia sanziniae]ANH79004.1 hypothetical protein Cs308_0834 [Candidatus Chlamydia sanziniae]
MAGPTPKINISLPIFVRFDIQSINLTEVQKNTALTVTESITTENAAISSNLTCTNGGVTCQQNLSVKQNINVTLSESTSIDFHGRLNLANTTVSYKDTSGNNRSDYTNINTQQPQQYVPFGYFKRSQPKTARRSATSGGHSGSGDFGTGTALPWNKFHQEEYTNTAGLTINGGKLQFTASTIEPKVFRISAFMIKDGRWLDNGTGGECVLEAVTNGLDIPLSITTSAGRSNFRTRPMQWFCSTFYTTTPGYFQIRNIGWSTFRVAAFSWNVVQLPYSV